MLEVKDSQTNITVISLSRHHSQIQMINSDTLQQALHFASREQLNNDYRAQVCTATAQGADKVNSSGKAPSELFVGTEESQIL